MFLSTEQNSETGASHTIYYASNPTGPNRTLADEFYGSLWGYCPWTSGGAYCSAGSTASNAAQANLADGSIHLGKWYGFFAGVGMSHRWPAIRVGGVLPPAPRRILIGLVSGAISNAASAQIVVTAPSGAQTMFSCSGSPCEVTVDDRQGAHLYRIQYLSEEGRVLSQTDAATLE